MKKLMIAALLATVLSAYANDVAEGRVKAESACALCHGPTVPILRVSRLFI